jgi:hypothetical protein
MEYVAMTVIVMAALLAFNKNVRRAAEGQMRSVGESFAFLRQYNPKTSIDCAYDNELKQWYSQACFDNEARKPENRDPLVQLDLDSQCFHAFQVCQMITNEGCVNPVLAAGQSLACLRNAVDNIKQCHQTYCPKAELTTIGWVTPSCENNSLVENCMNSCSSGQLTKILNAPRTCSPYMWSKRKCATGCAPAVGGSGTGTGGAIDDGGPLE